MSSFEIISDYSKANLREIPEKILEMSNLKMLFLEKNLLTYLPDEFFYRLPNLMWLDLRNNHLETLPKSIGHHEHLEHLLLTNNNIQTLPNELGLVSSLKALQITDNPLVYPPRKIIQEGTKAIKKYLRDQYEITCGNNAGKLRAQEKEKHKKESLERQQIMEMQEEKVIKVHEKNSDLSFDQSNNRISKESFYSAQNKYCMSGSRDSSLTNKRLNLDNPFRKFSDPKGLNPTLRVKKLDFPNKKQEEPLKIIHSINKSRSKISLKSYFNKTGIKGNLDRIPENSLKEGWLNKLRILLNDQERILQQERNLRALSSWRQKRPSTPKFFYDSDVSTKRSEAPFATYPEYSKMPSRSELTSQLQMYLRESEDLMNTKRPAQTNVNLDKLIDDLVEQLKEMEVKYSDVGTPRSELEQASRQIQTIVDIHRKLLKLKSANDYL